MLKIKIIVISILILLCMCVNICGCSASKDNSTVTENESQDISVQVQNATAVANNDDEIHLSLTKNYSEDLAWIVFTKGTDNQTYCGCIDKKGNLLFYTDKEIGTYNTNLTPYSNGYAYIQTTDSLYLLDKTGNIVKTYSNSSGNYTDKVIAYADGYVWYQEYVSDFDQAYYKYTLYDSKGNIVTDFQYDGTKPIESMDYYGKKVWGYDNKDGRKYYFTEGDKWVDSVIPSRDFHFCDDIALICPTHDSENSDIGFLSFIDTKGNLSYTRLPDDIRYSDVTCFDIYDDFCILYEHRKDYLISYNVKSKEFVKMDNKYTEKVNYDSLPDYSNELIFENGKVALKLKGTDGEYYVGLFDTSWNIIGEPIQSNTYKLSDEKFVVRDKDVYDDNLNLLFSASDFGYYSVSPYHNGIAHAKIEGMQTSSAAEEYGYTSDWFFIDEDGNRLFDSINTQSAIKIEL